MAPITEEEIPMKKRINRFRKVFKRPAFFVFFTGTSLGGFWISRREEDIKIVQIEIKFQKVIFGAMSRIHA